LVWAGRSIGRGSIGDTLCKVSRELLANGASQGSTLVFVKDRSRGTRFFLRNRRVGIMIGLLDEANAAFSGPTVGTQETAQN
jgi:hypothetical protein